MEKFEDEEILENKPKTEEDKEHNSRFTNILGKFLKGDAVIWMIIFILAIFSILVVYSATGTIAYRKGVATSWYLLKHGLLVLVSLLAIWIAHRIDYRYYARLSRFALIFSVPLLLIAWRFGVRINEAGRWINIPFINSSFQPSDLAKLALIASIASLLAKNQKNIQKSILPSLVWIGIICTLIGLADFSGAILLFLTCLLLMFIGRVPVKYLLLLILVGGLSGFASLALGERWGTVQSRTDKFLSDEVTLQEEQANIAIATGGLLGKLPGNSDQRNYLPNSFSDFVYAILIEEYGSMGGLLVLMLYLLLLYRGIMIVVNSKQPFGGLLSAGLTFALVIQGFINMAVSVSLIPITGVPLPLVSMGGTSLLFTGISLGIILSVSRGEIDETVKVVKGGNFVRNRLKRT